MNIQKLRDYLNPGGWRVYEQIKAETRQDHYEIDFQWLSEVLIDEYYYGVSIAERPELAKPDTGRPEYNWSTPRFDVESIKKHMADLVDSGAVIKEVIGPHICYIAQESPSIKISAETAEKRRREKRILRKDLNRTVDLVTRAMA